jgi:hypothetical protein
VGTLDLVRLEAHADDIPVRLKTTASSIAIDYSESRIGGLSFLLPQTTELGIIFSNGTEGLNTTRFSSCREFRAESTLSFDPAAKREDPRITAAPVEIPAGVRVEARVAGRVSMSESAAGDPIQAVVTADATVKGKVIIPKGSTLTGRIRYLQDYRRPVSLSPNSWSETFNDATTKSSGDRASSIIGFEFLSATLNGQEIPFRGVGDTFTGTVRTADGRSVPVATISTDMSLGSVTVLGFRERVAEIPKGFWMRLRTMRPAAAM